MEVRTYRTRIKGGHILCSEYAKARIAQMAVTIIGNYSSNRLVYDERIGYDMDGKQARIQERGDLILTCECTEKEYTDFCSQVEVTYPGLCIFDYKRKVQ